MTSGKTESSLQKSAPVVLGGENGALPIVRSLAKGGLRNIIVASERPDDQTFQSRYCIRGLVLERFDETTDKHNVALLAGLSQHLGERPVLYWGSDRETLFLNRNREELSCWYRFLLPEPELTDTLVDKGRFAVYAESTGLPVPKTLVFSNINDILSSDRPIPYPCTVKPAYMYHWYSDAIKKHFGSYKHTLRRLNNEDELRRYIQLFPPIDAGVVVQQFIEGGDDRLLSFHAFFDRDTRPIACFAGRKIRTNPIHFGGSAFIETTHRPDFIDFCLGVCRKIKFTGIVKIDCKLDASTGEYFILEFNPRFNLWEFLGTSAGINIPRIWYDQLVDNPVHPCFQYEAGRRWVYAAADLRALPSYIRTGEWNVRTWASSYRGRKVYHTFDWRDPLPFLTSPLRYVRRRQSRWRLRTSVEGGLLHAAERLTVRRSPSVLKT